MKPTVVTRSKRNQTPEIKTKIELKALPSLAQIRSLIEDENLTILHASKKLETSCTTLRKLCRTHKIGVYAEKPKGLVPTSSQIPFGWTLKSGLWVVHFQEWKWVEKICEMRKSGMSFHKIADELSQKIVPTKNGGVWSAKTVSQVIAFNLSHYEKFLEQKNQKQGEQIV